MRSVTGFVQAEAPHIRQSALCASCHTLITESIGPNGQVIGSFPEQMNYQNGSTAPSRGGEELSVVSYAGCAGPRARGVSAG